MRDFVHVASPLGVTHFMIMSSTKTAPYLRLARSPHGPTLTFKIHAYSLAADIARTQSRPRAPPSIFKTPPLVSTSLTDCPQSESVHTYGTGRFEKQRRLFITRM